MQNRVFPECDYWHQRLPAERILLVEDEIADAVIDCLALDRVDVLNDVWMMTNDDVGSCGEKLGGLDALRGVGFLTKFYPPMQQRNYTSVRVLTVEIGDKWE